MGKFIELTCWTDRDVIYIRSRNVISAYINTEEMADDYKDNTRKGSTSVLVRDVGTFSVVESPEEVVKRVEEADV